MELIGKTFRIHFVDEAGRILYYQGEILDVTNASYVIKDRKIGIIVLPIDKCRLEAENG